MAVKARTWTKVDYDVSDILTRCKEESGLSYRDIEARTGINYVRVRDICLAQHGTPTLAEYLAICGGFRLDPVDTLRGILADLPLLDDEQASDDAPLTADEIMTLAANTDPNRDIEAETPRD